MPNAPGPPGATSVPAPPPAVMTVRPRRAGPPSRTPRSAAVACVPQPPAPPPPAATIRRVSRLETPFAQAADVREHARTSLAPPPPPPPPCPPVAAAVVSAASSWECRRPRHTACRRADRGPPRRPQARRSPSHPSLRSPGRKFRSDLCRRSRRLPAPEGSTPPRAPCRSARAGIGERHGRQSSLPDTRTPRRMTDPRLPHSNDRQQQRPPRPRRNPKP